ncbi:MAG: TIGR00730 family Rossman fold protein [Paraprevotella sp.]|nr:TIGR00730 family Rossman fold protein [Paraprevotella sp.]
MNNVRSVCVYSASSAQAADVYVQAAHELGELLARKLIRLINGAGGCGLMRTCADSCLSAGGQVTGVIPRFMVDQGWHHPALSELIVTEDMHTRKQTMARLSDGVIALPGGCGTMEELLEIITWKQLGLYLNPIVVLNTDGYYDSLLNMLTHAVREHFMRPIHLDIWKVASTPTEAIDLIYSTPAWDKNIRKFAAL